MKDAPEQVVNFSVSTYPQIFLDNPTSAVPRGLVARGPHFFLPIEFNGRLGPMRINGEAGYDFGNHGVAQTWNRELLVGHEFSDRKTLNLLLMGGRSFRTINIVNGQSSLIAYVGFQLLWGPK